MARTPLRYAPCLEMDDEGMVVLVDPGSGPDDDAEFARLGRVDSPRTWDRCPEGLRDGLDALYGEYVEGLMESGEGRRELRRLYREGSLR